MRTHTQAHMRRSPLPTHPPSLMTKFVTLMLFSLLSLSRCRALLCHGSSGVFCSVLTVFSALVGAEKRNAGCPQNGELHTKPGRHTCTLAPVLWTRRDRENKPRKTCSHIRILFFFRFSLLPLLFAVSFGTASTRAYAYAPQAHSHSPSPCLSRYIALTYSGMMGALRPLPLIVVASATAHPLSLSVFVCVEGELFLCYVCSSAL